MITAEMLQLGITSTLQQLNHMIEIGMKPWENTLLPREDTLLPLQLIAVCIPDAAYD